MAQVTITQLPQALALTGNESVPIVQNGVTVQTTTGAIAVQPTLTQTFLTATQQTSLTNSRYLAVGSGLDTTDGGAQGTLQINLTGAPASLNSVGNGLMVKTDANTLTPRAIDVGTGLGITNANGVDGDPLIALGSFLANFQSMSGSTGLIGVSGGVVSPKAIAGTSGNIAVANGDGSTGDPTINLVSTGVTTGTFGSSSAIPVVTIDTFGRITSVTTAPTTAGGTVTEIDTGTGLTGGPITLSGTISLADTTVTAGTYGSSTLIPQFVVNAQGQITDVTEFSVIGGVASVTGTANEITASPTSGDVVLSLPSALTFTGKTITGGTYTGASISGSTNTLTNIGNSSLVNSTISGVALGSNLNALTIGTGLNGTSYNGSTPVTIALANTAVTTGTYGSSNYVPTFTVDQQGRLTAASETEITPSGIGAISAVNGTTNQITSSQVGTVVTVAIADAPLLTGPVKVKGTGTSSITPFAQSMQAWEANDNNFQTVYARNLNNGSDASADFVAYNDTSDVNSYFIDMGMNSSNFTSSTYQIFTPNSGYLFTGGGSSGQQSDLFIGTSNPASDIIFFTGDVLAANQRAMFNGTTGNLLLNTATDTGYTLNVNGTSYFGGASTFGSTVLLNANPTLALQAATKQYVDSAVSTGFVVHAAVRAATTANLATIYNNGSSGVGATLTADTNRAFTTLDGVTGWSLGQRVLVKNQTLDYENGAYTITDLGSTGVSPWVLTRATDFDVVGAGEVANNAYFYVTAGSTQIGTSWVLAQLAAITIGTTSLPFDLFAQPVAYTVVAPLSLTGTTLELTGVVASANGGTGTGTIAVGDMLYGSATDTWSKLALGSAYKSLVVNASGTQLEWNAVALNQASAVSGQLGIANGGTGTTVGVAGGAF